MYATHVWVKPTYPPRSPTGILANGVPRMYKQFTILQFTKCPSFTWADLFYVENDCIDYQWLYVIDLWMKPTYPPPEIPYRSFSKWDAKEVVCI